MEPWSGLFPWEMVVVMCFWWAGVGFIAGLVIASDWRT